MFEELEEGLSEWADDGMLDVPLDGAVLSIDDDFMLGDELSFKIAVDGGMLGGCDEGFFDTSNVGMFEVWFDGTVLDRSDGEMLGAIFVLELAVDDDKLDGFPESKMLVVCDGLFVG